MSENVAQIEIQTIDNTGNGLDSASTRFDNFGKQLENLDKNLKPLQSVLDGRITTAPEDSGSIDSCLPTILIRYSMKNA